MILFYSEYCKHCNILLETIKKHDKNNIIKLVSIDVLRSLQKPIDPKIHSVPALLILKTKEYLFGKAVFDYLLLPNRGVLFSHQTTRDDKKLKDSKEINNTIPNNINNSSLDEPLAFTLGSISSESFSNIDDTNEIINDKNYKWDIITDTEQTMKPIENKSNEDVSGKKKLPTMEEIMKQRASDIL